MTETTITKRIEFDTGHRIPGHKNKCKNLHGHRFILEVTASGSLIQTKGVSDEGMVMDFADIKQVMKEKIHDVLDHGFVMSKEDPFANSFAHLRDNFQQKILLVDFVPTSENLSIWCFNQLKDVMPEGVMLKKVRLYETPNSYAEYAGE